MTMLTFTKLEAELLAGRKLQTTRYNAEYWLKRYHAWLDNRGITIEKDGEEHFLKGLIVDRPLTTVRITGYKNYLNIWWIGPRHRNPAAYKMGIGSWFTYDIVKGKDLTDFMAERDGFATLEEYLSALGKLHKMTRAEVLEHEWGIIEWRWVEGPSKPDVIMKAVTADGHEINLQPGDVLGVDREPWKPEKLL